MTRRAAGRSSRQGMRAKACAAAEREAGDIQARAQRSRRLRAVVACGLPVAGYGLRALVGAKSDREPRGVAHVRKCIRNSSPVPAKSASPCGAGEGKSRSHVTFLAPPAPALSFLATARAGRSRSRVTDADRVRGADPRAGVRAPSTAPSLPASASVGTHPRDTFSATLQRRSVCDGDYGGISPGVCRGKRRRATAVAHSPTTPRSRRETLAPGDTCERRRRQQPRSLRPSLAPGDTFERWLRQRTRCSRPPSARAKSGSNL